MALPSMLQKESEKLEAELQEHFNGAPVEQPVSEPVQFKQEQEVIEPVAPEPVTPPVQVTPPVREPEPRHVEGLGDFAEQQTVQPQKTDWEQKYKSLDGRIKKENEGSQAYQNENAELKTQVEQLQREAEQNRVKSDAGAYLTSEQREEFDDEQIAMAASVAKGVISPAVEQLQGEVKALRTIMAESQTDHAQQLKETFTRELLRLVPDWYELNDPRNMATLHFREWLHEVDPSTGIPRIDIMNHACRNRETERVARWVNDYKQSRGIAPSPTRVPPQESLVEPRGSSGSATSTEPGKPTFSVTDAKNRYEEIARRLTSGRVSGEERNKLQTELDDLDRAFAEGRVFDKTKTFV